MNLKNREIYLHTYISDAEPDTDVDYKYSLYLQKNLSYLDLVDKPILIHMMNNNGGSLYSGYEIYNTIKYSTSYIGMLCYGHAFSCGSFILQAADLRIVSPTTHLLIHHGTTSNEGTNKEFDSYLELIKTNRKTMIEIYASRCIDGAYFQRQYKSLTLDKVKVFLTKQLDKVHDWYLDPEKAIDFGFADGILGSEDYPDLTTVRTEVGVL